MGAGSAIFPAVAARASMMLMVMWTSLVRVNVSCRCSVIWRLRWLAMAAVYQRRIVSRRSSVRFEKIVLLTEILGEVTVTASVRFSGNRSDGNAFFNLYGDEQSLCMLIKFVELLK